MVIRHPNAVAFGLSPERDIEAAMTSRWRHWPAAPRLLMTQVHDPMDCWGLRVDGLAEFNLLLLIGTGVSGEPLCVW